MCVSPRGATINVVLVRCSVAVNFETEHVRESGALENSFCLLCVESFGSMLGKR